MKDLFICRPYGVTDSEEVDYSTFDLDSNWNIGIVADIEFWVECANQWCWLNNEPLWVNEMYKNNCSNDEIFSAINEHWDLNIAKANKKEIAEYIKKNIFSEEPNEFLKRSYISA